jgi:hypothetical protein
VYEVEPNIDETYRPDAYTRLKNEQPALVEVQRSHVSNKIMQGKVDGWVDTFRRGKHDARTLIIVGKEKWTLRAPEDMQILYAELKEGAI